jgi:hypothetical protein
MGDSVPKKTFVHIAECKCGNATFENRAVATAYRALSDHWKNDGCGIREATLRTREVADDAPAPAPVVDNTDR